MAASQACSALALRAAAGATFACMHACARARERGRERRRRRAAARVAQLARCLTSTTAATLPTQLSPTLPDASTPMPNQPPRSRLTMPIMQLSM